MRRRRACPRSVPWLLWDGGMGIHCDRCGEHHEIPARERISVIIAFYGAVEKVHRHCPRRPEDIYLGYW